MIVLVPLTIETTDRLHERAVQAFLTIGAGDPEDIERTLGTAEEPNVARCIRELYWADDHHDFTTLNEAPIALHDDSWRTLEPIVAGDLHDEIA